MNNFYYSKSENAFYSLALKEQYVSAGSWPDDAFPVEDSVYEVFALSTPPDKKIRVPGDDGLPAWGDIPSPSDDDIIAANERTKLQLRSIADSEIEWRQDAVDAGIAMEEETAALAEWKKYRVLLMRVDTADPDWPILPAVQAS